MGSPPSSKCLASAAASRSVVLSPGPSFEPLRAELVAEPLVVVGEHRVSGLAHDRVAEGELLFAREAALFAAHEHLALHQLAEPADDVRRFRGRAEERLDAPAPERSAEDARRAEEAARVVLHVFEARAHHREDGAGHLGAAAVGLRADQLLEEEGVSACLIDDPREGLGGLAVAEDVAREALARAARQLRQRELHDVRPLEQGGERGERAGPREREDEERLLAALAEEGLDHLRRRHVAPVHVLEHEEQRRLAALGLDEILPGAAHLIAHQHGVAARVAELGAPLVGEGDADDLAQELRDPKVIRRGHRAAHAGDELASLDVGRLVVAEICGAAEDLRDHPEGGLVAHRIAARDPHVGAARDAEEQLREEARFPAAGRRGHDHRARHGLRGALRERRLEERQLALAAHEGRRPAEERARRLLALLEPEQQRSVRVLPERGAPAEERRRHVVDADARRGVPAIAQASPLRRRPSLRRGGALLGAHEARGALEGLADPLAAGDLAAPRHEAHRRGGELRAEAQRALRRDEGLILRRAAPRDDREHGAVREPLHARAVGREELSQPGHLRVHDRRRRRAHLRRLALGPAAADHHDARDAPLARRERRDAEARRRGLLRRVAAGRRAIDEAVERARHLLGRRPLLRLLGEHERDELVEGPRDVRVQLAGVREIRHEHLREDRHHVVARERALARDHLEEHAPEREDVRGRRHLARAARLLRRHVSDRPEHSAVRRRVARGLGDARDAEVDELDLRRLAAQQEDVGRLHVAVDHARRVRRRERLRHAVAERDGVGEAQLLALRALPEILAVEPLHREEGPLVVEEPVRHVPHDPGVAHLHQRVGLALHAARLAHREGVQDLQRHGQPRGEVLGAEDSAHPAFFCEPLDLEPLVQHVPRAHGHLAYLAPS